MVCGIPNLKSVFRWKCCQHHMQSADESGRLLPDQGHWPGSVWGGSTGECLQFFADYISKHDFGWFKVLFLFLLTLKWEKNCLGLLNFEIWLSNLLSGKFIGYQHYVVAYRYIMLHYIIFVKLGCSFPLIMLSNCYIVICYRYGTSQHKRCMPWNYSANLKW